MPLRKPVFALLAPAGAAAFGIAAASCSSSSSPAAPPPVAEAGVELQSATCTNGGLTIAFNPMYSAFDGTHTFQVPAVVVGSTQEVTWFGDSSMVGMQADTERPNEVLLTMLKPGITTIHVQSTDGKCGSAPLTISAALESDWEIGSKRYNDGISVHLSGPAKAGTGSPLESDGMVGPACTNCHGETATNSAYTDVSHTPEQTGGFSDADLLNIILNGTFPANGTFDWSIVAYPVWQSFHRWTDITSDQQAGIIVYLRSLTPAPQKGAPNFGAFDNMDSGMTTVVTSSDAGADGTTAEADAEAGAVAESGDETEPVESGLADANDAAAEASSDADAGPADDGGAESGDAADAAGE